jgi:hypothetical protein
VEDFYQSQESDTVFEEQLVKLYRMVLECQVALIAHFRRNGLCESHYSFFKLKRPLTVSLPQ